MNINTIHSAMLKTASVRKAANTNLLKKKATIQALLERCGFVKTAAEPYYGDTEQAKEIGKGMQEYSDALKQSKMNEAKKPMLGRPFPSGKAGGRWDPYEVSGGRSDVTEENVKHWHPYTYARWKNSPEHAYDWHGIWNPLFNTTQFDTRLHGLWGEAGGNEPYTQEMVDKAREGQAKSIAYEIAEPLTNQYDDAVQMLIQAGKNNQEAFENTGETLDVSAQSGEDARPAGYNGPNRLSREQKEWIRNYYPSMGDTTNSQRFANWG